MKRQSPFIAVAVGVLLCLVITARGAAPETGLANPVALLKDAQALLDRVQAAYMGLEALELAGTMTLRMEVAGERIEKQKRFTAAYQSPGIFRHDIEGDLLAVATDRSLYLLDQQRNLYSHVEIDPKQKGLRRLPSPVVQILQLQNPSLLMALSGDAKGVLLEGVQTGSLEGDAEIDGASYTLLQLEGEHDSALVLIDPKTHLLKRLTLDITPQLQKRDKGVRSAVLEFDYSRTNVDPALEADRLAWQAPAGAREVELTAGGSDLVGKEAPAFTLKDLDGKEVSLSDHRGKVVVLDFWATWCGPCVQSMPGLEQVRKDYADRGVAILTINQPPDTVAKVRAFLDEHGLELPVLMDSDSQVAEAYNVSGIPTTVVIASDGVVLKMMQGFAPASGHNELREAIDAGLAGGDELLR